MSTQDRRRRRRTAPVDSPQPANTQSPVVASGGENKSQVPAPALPPSFYFPSAAINNSNDADNRDLASLLSYGPAHLPYTSAWTDSRIEQVRAFKHWVYIAVHTIASKIAATIPNVTYVTSGASLKESSESKFLRRKALLPLLAHQRLEPVPDDHPLLRLLLDPNDPDTCFDLFYETLLFNRLTGSAYWWVPRNEITGLPDAIWCLPSHWVWPVYGNPAQGTHLQGWELRPVEGNYLRRFLPAEEVIVFRHKNPISKIDGYSPMTAAPQWVDMVTMVNSSRWHAYRNGTFPTVAVQFDGTHNDPTDEDLRRIEAKFLTRYVGEHKSNKPLFLPPGVKVSPLTLKPNEMLFGETAIETRNNILALYGVPPIIAGVMDGMNRGALDAAQIGFFSLTINPLLRFMGQVLTEKLARLYDSTLKIWWEDMVPEDPVLLEDKIKTDLLAGALTPNEIRLMRGRQPYPEGWGDQPIAPVNMQILPLGGDSSHLLPSNDTTQPEYSSKE